jgi:acyl-[acyl-carrier-protein]-phospholipid O-acyltransferase/long-chain-fatty-acid--[acyl-carrier-protein] ligase
MSIVNRKFIPKGSKIDHSFAWLNATQFLGAANDNLFKGLMIFLIIGKLGQEKASSVSAIAGLAFVVPFLLLTSYAGTLADRHSKRTIVVLAKVAEILIMLLGALAFWLGSPMLCYAIMFLMAAQSAFFGPSKYGIIPELVDQQQLSRANSSIEGATYLAVVIGIAAAPGLTRLTGENYLYAQVACIAIAVAGTLTSIFIHKTPAGGLTSQSHPVFVVDVWRTMQLIKSDGNLVASVFGAASFMFLGGFAQLNLIPYGIQVCGLDQIDSGYLFLLAAVGIGLGSFWAGKLSGRGLESGLVPFGALLLGLGAIGLAISRTMPWIYTEILLMGIGAGLYIVPIQTFIQMRAKREILGRIIAASNTLGWIGVALASVMIGALGGWLGVPAATLFIGLGCIALIIFAISLYYLREYVLRFVLSIPIRLAYRIRVYGEENLPVDGGALLVSNHLSWVDGLVLSAVQHRRIRFLVDRPIYESKPMHYFFRFIKAIPISATDGPRHIIESLQKARQAIEQGYTVCIFAEGVVTRTGHMAAFRGGLEKIVKTTNCPIIPVFLGGLWDSVFSHRYGKIFARFPKPLQYPITVHFGKPMPTDSTARQIRQAVLELSCDWIESRKYQRLTLAQTFVKVARRNWNRPCIADTTGKKLTFGRTLIAAIVFAKKYRPYLKHQKNIGILLPSGVAGVLANIATGLLRKTAVNLNFTVSQADRDMAIEQCGIRTIVTSRAFLEKLGLDPKDTKYLFAEDLAGQITQKNKQRAWFKARFAPAGWIGGRRKGPDDTAAILYSSGSSSRPKGIMLSHHNIMSNLETVRTIFKFDQSTRLCGVLPFFHSFGLTCTLWLPLLSGVSVYYVSNPLDGRAVGQTVGQNQCTILFATPTFLTCYLRRCEKDEFRCLEYVVVGAEKLKQQLIDSFHENFGIRPLEGYGATELSPMISLNVPDVEVGGGRQQGTKAGSVGRPIPGVATRVVDPETGQPVEPGHPGVLWIKGANVMKGYLNDSQKTAEVIADGWYNTGDIVTIDDEGFITITDRLGRFSKIAGEMVSHTAIEDVCYKGLNLQDRVLAATTIPDQKKGEQIVILYVKSAVDADRLFEVISQSNLPNIAKPKRENLVPVDAIPQLGSGKTDFQTIKKIAAETKTTTGS